MRFLNRVFLLTMIFPVILYSETGIRSNEEKKLRKAFDGFSGRYVIYVNKKKFSLTVYNNRLKAVKKFKIGYGLNPDKKPKLYLGDERTPEGKYKVTEILSLRADRSSEAYQKLKALNRIYFRAKHGYYKFGREDEDLGRKSFGPRLFRLDYPNNDDVKRYNEALAKGEIPVSEDGSVQPIGSGIGIHGNNDPPSIGHLSSGGCIRLYNRDVIKLDKYIEIDTPVIISPE